MTETTQRAYTLRLNRFPGKCQSCGSDLNCTCWRDILWKTHEAVNKGVKAFGDWLLTLRGGLDHKLAEASLSKRKNPSPPTSEEKKQRQILLALSWLSVESAWGAPEKYIVASGSDPERVRSDKLVQALHAILVKRKLHPDEINQWIENCKPSLGAAIRQDAVWVNRSHAFDDAVANSQEKLSREDIWDFLGQFFDVSEYLSLNGLGTDEDGEEEIRSDSNVSAKDLAQKAGKWLSQRFGSGKGADFEKISQAYQKIAEWAGQQTNPLDPKEAINSLAQIFPNSKSTGNTLDDILEQISGPGHKSKTRNILRNAFQKETCLTLEVFKKLEESAKDDAETCKQKKGKKGDKAYADFILEDVEKQCGCKYKGNPARHAEYAVMLDHAARRVSMAHTWIKRAEASREQFEEHPEEIETVPESVKNWLDRFCKERAQKTGALDPVRIRRAAIEGWEKIVGRWVHCQNAEERKQVVKTVQAECQANDEKFGDAALFEALAENEALPIWHQNGDRSLPSDPKILRNYVRVREAEFKKQQFKVPAYCHPDPLRHPVFCDFGNSRWRISFSVHEAKKSSNQQHESSTVTLTLWDGKKFEEIPFHWSCKRLSKDLALKDPPSAGNQKVTRNDRLGRAAANVPEEASVGIWNVFEEKNWNGRLQAPRDQLNTLASWVERHGWDQKAHTLRARIRWLLSFSPKLQAQGPWFDYTAKWPNQPIAQPFIRKKEYGVQYPDKSKRKGMAQFILARLPSLRVLSIDLGHRHAAACAVWETLSTDALKKEIEGAQIKAGGIGPDNLYLHLEQKNKDGKQQTRIYRRIAADVLPEGSPHPASWARLDRQFLIPLQGEKENARKATSEELKRVNQFLTIMGFTPLDPLPHHVDDLMAFAVSCLKRVLQRHSQYARIAHHWIADKKLLPGGKEEILTPEQRVDLLIDTLVDWYSLCHNQNATWKDERPPKLWSDLLQPHLNGAQIQLGVGSDCPQGNPKQKEQWKEKLKPLAQQWVDNPPLLHELHQKWKTLWEQDNDKIQQALRWLRDWILPRGKNLHREPSLRNVGGLSLQRLALFKSLYQLQKAFRMKPEPDNPRKNIPPPGDTSLDHFGATILRNLEQMREQRLKQLASRIVEAALGVGIESPSHGRKEKPRPRERINDPRFAPCHAVVIENLEHYRPDETKTRRENRQLMTWNARNLRKFLIEACQLHGLLLREVSAAYTSRQDSRTGAPGIRCEDVPLEKFLKSPYWRERIQAAEKKQSEGKGNELDGFLVDLDANGKTQTANENLSHRCVRVPREGGDIFVSSDPNSPAAKGLQADLNAAANIGLRALLDPDWEGAWWYIPCQAQKFLPAPEKVAGSQAIPLNKPLKTSEAISKEKESKLIVNLWRSPSARPIDSSDTWLLFDDYWTNVQAKVCHILRSQANLNRHSATQNGPF